MYMLIMIVMIISESRYAISNGDKPRASDRWPRHRDTAVESSSLLAASGLFSVDGTAHDTGLAMAMISFACAPQGLVRAPLVRGPAIRNRVAFPSQFAGANGGITSLCSSFAGKASFARR